MDMDWSPLACNIFFSDESLLEPVWEAKARKMKFRFAQRNLSFYNKRNGEKKMHYYSASAFIRDRVPLQTLNFGAMKPIER